MFGPACKYWIFFISCTAVSAVTHRVQTRDIPTEYEHLAKYAEKMQECAQRYVLNPDDVTRLRNHELSDVDRTAKCFLACAFRSNDMMDERGMIDLEKMNEITQLFLSSTPAQMKSAMEYTDACAYVNTEPVSDGDEGCDRAALIFKCMVQKSKQQEALINPEVPKYDF